MLNSQVVNKTRAKKALSGADSGPDAPGPPSKAPTWGEFWLQRPRYPL